MQEDRMLMLAVVIGLLLALGSCAVPDQQALDVDHLIFGVLSQSRMSSSLMSKSSSSDSYEDDDYDYGVPTVSDEEITRNATITVVNLNRFTDEAIRQKLNLVYSLPLFPIRQKFSLQLENGRQLKGVLRAPYGVLQRIGNVARAGDVKLIKVNNTIRSTGAFSVYDADLLYNKVYVNFLNTFVFGSVRITVSKIFSRYANKFTYINDTACDIKIEDFELSFHNVKVYIDGLSEKEFTLSYWLGAIINYLGKDIRNGILSMYSGMLNRSLTHLSCTTLYHNLFPLDVPK
ncbi:uncharacterized protein [Periplaneta americana]|uniref:uncharacterized protein n=1 Tax=Periplaneta americana TaxID=6978 RepID=UPI0037E823B4